MEGTAMSIDAKHDSLGLSARIVALYGKLADGDVMGLLESLDRDIEWVVPDGLHFGGTARFNSEWDGFTIEPDEVFEAGDVVIALGHYRAANKATGRPMTARFAHVWRLRDGQPVRFETIPDTHAMVRTMGVEQS
ncbi:nuclear transport factor 2 family protein [Micromonospora sp. NPDC000668]|uniref:nuclear transport factor 2 family protein n=1 Tax=Micromonospora sp. NPDC000668 TaxID=3364219 RepID=UPI00369B855A